MPKYEWERKPREGVMLCYPFEEDRLESDRRIAWNRWPVLTQPKLDGVRARMMLPKQGALQSSTAEPIFSVKHIKELLQELKCPYLLDGELYKHGMPFDDIQSRVMRTVNQHEDDQVIEFHVFDYVDEQCEEPFLVRAVKLAQWFADNIAPGHPIKLVPTHAAGSKEEVFENYQTYLRQGFEGIIVRHPDGVYQQRRMNTVMKFKPKRSDIYNIVGVKEELDKNGIPKGTLGALICSADVDSADTFSVGSGFSTWQRKDLWSKRDSIIGANVMVEYQHLTKDSVPRFPVFHRIIQRNPNR